MAKKKKLPTFRRQNIPDELFNAWKSLRRKNDAKAIKTFIADRGRADFSESTINNALGYGFVHSDDLRETISMFFDSRNRIEVEEAERISNQKQ